MEYIRDWAFSLCAAMIACSMLRLMLPRGSMRRIFGLTLGVFLLCCCLTPFFLARPEFRLELDAYPEQESRERSRRLSETVEKQRDDAVRAGIQKIILSELEEMGISGRVLAISISITQGDITAELTLDAALEAERAAIERRLGQELGFPVKAAFA